MPAMMPAIAGPAARVYPEVVQGCWRAAACTCVGRVGAIGQ
jgi:hypothetical protein